MIQHAATVSLEWFENMNRHKDFPFYQFAFGCMTRSKKVTFENLQIRDKSFTDKALNEFLETHNLNSPAFTPFKLRDLELQNRIVMVPIGTQLDVYNVGYEWINHSLKAIPFSHSEEQPRVKISSSQCTKPYMASMFNISAMSWFVK